MEKHQGVRSFDTNSKTSPKYILYFSLLSENQMTYDDDDDNNADDNDNNADDADFLIHGTLYKSKKSAVLLDQQPAFCIIQW